jgi:hypothetical protein
MDDDDSVQYAVVSERKFAEPKPFSLAPAPTPKSKPQVDAEAIAASKTGSPAPVEKLNDHVPAAPGETQYGAVAIPGAYTGPAVNSPGFAPQHTGQAFDFGLDSRVRR